MPYRTKKREWFTNGGVGLPADGAIRDQLTHDSYEFLFMEGEDNKGTTIFLENTMDTAVTIQFYGGNDADFNHEVPIGDPVILAIGNVAIQKAYRTINEDKFKGLRAIAQRVGAAAPTVGFLWMESVSIVEES